MQDEPSLEKLSSDGDTSAAASAPSPTPPATVSSAQSLEIPEYEMLKRIGQGSYGEVWLARTVMDEYRAIKVVYRKTFEYDRPYEREFQGIKKYEPISRKHDSQVHILHVGRNDAAGYFYYVMDLADDANDSVADDVSRWLQPSPALEKYSTRRVTLAATYVPKTLKSELDRRGRLPFEECLQIGLALTTALDHLHRNELVHRDIKPSNIVFVQGVPKLADIGLVTAISEAKSIVGTEGYMAPEGLGTAQADLYSLGKVLYEISMGRKGQTFPELPPDWDELANKEELLELNEVLLKACEGDLRIRYQSAREMQADLALLQRGHSVKRLHTLERRLALVTRVGTLLVVLALIAAGVLYQTNRERRLATQNLVRLHVANGTRLMSDGDLFGSLLSFTEALRLDAGNTQREEPHRIRIASVLEQCPKLVGVFGHQALINGAVLSPDGRHLITGSDDNTAKVWDLDSGTVLFTLQHTGPVYTVAFGPDNKVILTTSSDNRAHLWNAATGEPLRGPPIQHRGSWLKALPRFSPDSGRVLTLLLSREAQVWDLASGQRVGPPLRHGPAVSFFSFSPNGSLIVTTGDDNRACVWDSFTGELRFSFLHGGTVNHASFSPDNRVLATASSEARASFWDLQSGKLLPTPLEHRHRVDAVSYSPEGDRLLTQCWDKSVLVWDIEKRKPLSLPITHDLQVYNVRFNPDGRRVVTASGDSRLRMWDADTRELIVPILRHSDWREPAAFSSDGRFVLTFEREAVRVWDIGRIRPPPLQIAPVRSFKADSVSRNERFKVAIGGDNAVRTIDLNSHEWLPQLDGLTAPILQAFFGSDSEILITQNADTRAQVWNPATGEPLTPLLHTQYALNAPRISKSDLPYDRRPVADLVALAQVLSGELIDETGGFRPLEAEESIARWTNLTARHLVTFRPSSSEAFAWHEQEARTCEQDWNWWSALSHLDWLIERRPQDQPLRHRRAYAQMALEQANRAPGGYPEKAHAIPPRDPSASAEMIDLTRYYNTSKRDGYNSLSALPCGVQTFDGTAFDVRGVIQLSSPREKLRAGRYPEQITDVKVGRKCRRLHFLQATTSATKDRTIVGTYVVRYADSQTQTIQIVYGKDLRSWRTDAGEPLMAQQAVLAWVGSNPLVQSLTQSLRIFKSSWENPRPNDQVESIDFISSMSEAAPFLVALTAE